MIRRAFFVIVVDRAAGEIVVPPLSAGQHTRARGAWPQHGVALLALIREGLVSQLSHAAYLGAELAKAEASLRLTRVTHKTGRSVPNPPARRTLLRTRPRPRPDAEHPIALTWDELSAKAVGDGSMWQYR